MRPADIAIREATDRDRAAIIAVASDAFGRGSDEDIALIEKIWRLPGHLPSLELVALVEHVVVGHVLYSLGEIGTTAVPGLAPLAVAPAYQRAGIGSALVTRSLRLAKAGGYPLVIVTGRPAYYSRFGFAAAAEMGISPTNPEAFADLNAFMAKALRTTPGPRGVFRYAWQSAGDHIGGHE